MATMNGDGEPQHNFTKNNEIAAQLHDLRLDMRRLEANGIAGNLLLAWWLYPIKFVADPVFEAAETLVIPNVTNKGVPFVDDVVSFGLNTAQTIAHTVYGAAAATGLVSSNNESYEDIRALAKLQALRFQSNVWKEQFLHCFYAAAEAGKQQSLLDILNESSDCKSLTTDTDEDFLALMYHGYSALFKFSRDPYIFEQVQTMGRLRFAENKAILSVIQQSDLQRHENGNTHHHHHYHSHRHHRADEMLADDQDEIKYEILSRFTMEEALHYMKFAMAAYGDNAIQLMQQQQQTIHNSKHNNKTSSFDWRKSDWTAAQICKHTGIPDQNDIILFDTDNNEDIYRLHHFVALDHAKKKIILAMRGTYTNSTATIDNFNGYARAFLGGEAPLTLSIMAERLWNNIGNEILHLMNNYFDYELILTGHSILGGGCTCLINLILHTDPRMEGRRWRAFAYGSPPVYVPLSNVSLQAGTCVNYIHRYDGIPFLSGDSVRHQIAMLSAIDKAESLDTIQRGRLLLGLDVPGNALIDQIHDIQRMPLSIEETTTTTTKNNNNKGGCPRHMAVPSMGNIWMIPNKEESEPENAVVAYDSYKIVIADSIKMSETGIFVHKDEVADHLPSTYEHVLDCLVKSQQYVMTPREHGFYPPALTPESNASSIIYYA